jgi:hypothetical protein
MKGRMWKKVDVLLKYYSSSYLKELIKGMETPQSHKLISHLKFKTGIN